MNLTLSDSAVKRLEILRQEKQAAYLFLCLRVQGGGCQGFEYQISLSEILPDTDAPHIRHGDVGLVTDSVSLPFLAGSVVDYEDALIGAKFVVKNPNAVSSCGCGTSFNLA